MTSTSRTAAISSSWWPVEASASSCSQRRSKLPRASTSCSTPDIFRGASALPVPVKALNTEARTTMPLRLCGPFCVLRGDVLAHLDPQRRVLAVAFDHAAIAYDRVITPHDALDGVGEDLAQVIEVRLAGRQQD